MRPGGGAPAAAADLLADVVDPWRWPRATGATDRERAIEDIGPYERVGGEPINPNGRYWTTLVGIAWDRDVDIDFDREPVDLDGDNRADTEVTRHVHVKGGILADPETFGLVRTPDDPRGRVGRISASTGVLGLREALDEQGKPTGQIGMTCWLCHGGRNPADGSIAYGLPNTAFDYGLLLATASVLDDRNEAAAGDRRARGFPSGRTVRARLLLAGPGRQDLTGEFGLDMTVAGTHSLRYPGAKRLRQGTKGIVNPLSVPPILAWPDLRLQNWSGSESSDDPWLERLVALARAPRAEARAAFGLPVNDERRARRALLLDLRNLGTLGLQQDSFPGLLWADALRGKAEITPAALREIPEMYAARPVRALVTETAAHLARPKADAARVERGRAIFEDRVAGRIANRQILKYVPAAYAAAKLAPPILAPIEPGLPVGALLPVHCADCHGGNDAMTTSRLLPFDVDGDGVAQGDEADDARSGGIGTESLLAFDVPKPERPFSLPLSVITDLDKPAPVKMVATGVAWVRVAPLHAVFATAPYLHNGSVPTLRSLLDPARKRPVTFELGKGAGRFVFDVRVPGNRNIGHEFGVDLTPSEKDDLVAYLTTL